MIKKHKEWVFKVNDLLNIFGYTIIVVITNDVNASIHKRAPEWPKTRTCAAFHIGKRGSSTFILAKDYYSDNVAHEAYHALQNLFGYIGEDVPSEEFGAYMIGFFLRSIKSIYFTKLKARLKKERNGR